VNNTAISRRQFNLWATATLAASGLPLSAFAEQTTIQGKTLTLPDGSRIPILGMGSARLASGRHPIEQEVAALKRGLQLGMPLIDTAEIYSNGVAEQLVGRAIADRRSEAFVVSKIAPRNATSAKNIRLSCQRSLHNLNTNYLDLYLLHWRDGEDLKLVVETFEALKTEGKIRHWGVSNFSTEDMNDLFSIKDGTNCAVNQVRYSLVDRSIESSGLLAFSIEHQLPLMAYTPLGRGDDSLLKNPALAEVAYRHQVSPAVAAIAWTLRSGNVICIAESGNINHIRDNSQAQWLTLDKDDLVTLDKAFPA